VELGLLERQSCNEVGFAESQDGFSYSVLIMYNNLIQIISLSILEPVPNPYHLESSELLDQVILDCQACQCI